MSVTLRIFCGSIVAVIGCCGMALAQSFVNFETPHVHPVDLSPNGDLLATCNTADNRVELFSVVTGTPVPIRAIPVGLDPVSVRFRTDDELWVVNQISDSISVINLTTSLVETTIDTKDKPADVVFAGAPERAYVTCSTDDVVQVYNTSDLSAAPTEIAIDGEEPRALAVSVDGSQVYVAIFESGNGSTILGGGLDKNEPNLPNAVSDPAGPHGGVNPPPNDGANFTPPIDSTLPAPPAVGLIVKKDAAGAWMDDNSGDWTDMVSGSNAIASGRVPGWDVLDNDVAIIDTATDTVTSYATGLMNICMAITVNPATSTIGVVGTDGTNEIRFEPNLTGTFLRVLGAEVNPNTLSKTVTDLNFHLDYSTGTIAQAQRDLSLGDPRGAIWNAAGDTVYITGMGSNNVQILEVGTGASLVDLGEGPTGIALDEARSRAYVLNRFSADLSVIDTAAKSELTRVAFFDPTPDTIRIGRKHLYDTHKNSGLGQVACASCHVDSKIDRLAWDLGNPAGEMKTVSDQNMGAGLLVAGFEDFHPMKGPMTTQTLQDIIGIEPFHWRGDKRGLEEFNGAFTGLQGDDTMLSDAEMQEFEDFLATIHFPPNPNRNWDNSLPTNLPLPGEFASGRFAGDGGLDRGDPMPNGDAQRGLRLYMGTEAPNFFTDGQVNCVTCHSLPTGAGPDSFFNPGTGMFDPFPIGEFGNHHAALVSTDGNTQKSFKTPQLRNMIEKAGMTLALPISRAGFGYLHDGSVDSLTTFLSSLVFDVRNDQDVADLTALMLSFGGSDFGDPAQNPPFSLSEEPPSFHVGRDAHALVGQQVTFNTPTPDFTVINQIMVQAGAGAIDAVVKGNSGGESRGWVYTGGSGFQTQWQSDKAGETATGQDLLNLAATGNEMTLTAVPQGSGTRIGIDRDEDGIFNADDDAQQAIFVASPNGGVTWQAGTTHPIVWSSTGLDGQQVNIHLFLMDGTLVRTLARNVPIEQQVFDWTIDPGEAPRDDYAIVINRRGSQTLWDASDTPFAITN